MLINLGDLLTSSTDQLKIAIIDSSDTWYAQPKLIYDELIKLGHNVLWLARPNNEGFKKNDVPPGYVKICIANNLSPIDVFTDKPMELNHPPLERAYYSDADLVFVGDKNIFLKFFSSKPNAYYLPYAVDPGVFKNLNIPEIYDVGFIGNIRFEERKRRIEKLKKHFNVFIGNKLFMEDANKAMNRCKIIFNTCDGKELNMRVFEGLAIGKLLVTEQIAFLDELFTNKEHLVTYSSDDELVEMVKTYLADESERKKISLTGFNEVVRKHTYLHRAKFIIDKILQFDTKYEHKKSQHIKSDNNYRTFYENQASVNRTAQERIFDFNLPDPDSDGKYDIRNRLKEALKVAKGKVLDIGCQRGGYSFNLKNIGCDVTAIDISMGYVKQAKEKVSDIQFAQSDAGNLPFKENTFDTIILSEVLEHVTDETKVTTEVKRVVKDGGTIFITVPAYEDDSEEHVRFLNKGRLVELFSECIIEFKDNFNLKSTVMIAQKLNPGERKIKSDNNKLRVLLTNHHLIDFTGSEIYTLTLAEQLAKKGHDVVVYSRYVDKTKILFDEIGIRVVENIDEIKNIHFDVAHVHHNINAMELRNIFPELPIVYLSQGVIPFLEQPPVIDLHISKYFSLSDEVANNLISSGIPHSKIILLGNMIDEIKFLPRSGINENPRNALVISGRIDSEKENVIRNACSELNINLKFIGGRFGEVSQHEIKTLIEESDVVFSLGRGAIEAMMMGRAVIIYDYLGGDGMITENNFTEIKKNNFSGRRFKKNFSVIELINEIKKYDITSVMNVRNLAIQNFSAAILTDELVKHYEDAIAKKVNPLQVETKRLLEHFINIINETRNYSFDIAARKYNKMTTQEPSENNLQKAEQLIEKNNYSGAKLVLTEMLKENPLDFDALNNLAVITILEKNLDEAQKIISLILQLDSTNEVALGNLEYIKQQSINHIPEEIEVNTFSSYDDFKNYSFKKESLFKERAMYEKFLVVEEDAFTIPGYCKVCEKDTNFLVDYLYAYQNNGTKIPNWRERLVCPVCGLNNRMRAAIHLLKTVTKPKPDARIYISEQTTQLYQYFLKNYPNTVGSEYLGDKYKPGEINESGIRNEDFTNLTFIDNKFDLVLSFEVFEHIPDFINAFSESLRILKPGGHLIFTVPFNTNAKSNLVRAVITNGIVEHIHPPEYHGNPVNSSEGCLCYYHFGWEVLEQLKTAGFENVNAMSFYSKEFGYLGGEQLFFVAQKSINENYLNKENKSLKQNKLVTEKV